MNYGIETNRGQKPFTLLALFREHNEEFRKRVGVDRKEETYESYENSYNILASFVKKRKEKEDVEIGRASCRERV